MFCRWCLYDLSRTTEPRCPECGGAFVPGKAHTMLPTASRWAWFMHHGGLYLAGFRDRAQRDERKFCRECYADLCRVAEDKCPVCRKWFNARDPGTYRRSDHGLARLYDRFRHICIWRGVLIPLVPLIIGLEAVLTQSTLLPGYGRAGVAVDLLRLFGWPAVSMGMAWMGVALMLHAQYFWHRVEPFWRYAGLGFYGGACMILGGWGYALYWAIMHTMP